jgi:hypothetical protein
VSPFNALSSHPKILKFGSITAFASRGDLLSIELLPLYLGGVFFEFLEVTPFPAISNKGVH